MKQEKVKEIAKAMSGLSYREFEEVASIIEASYHVTKKRTDLRRDQFSN